MMKKALFLIFFLFCHTVFAADKDEKFQIPLQTSPSTFKVINVFGKSLIGVKESFFKGLIFINNNIDAQDTPISPISPGDVFFTFNADSTFLPTYYSKHNLIAIEHSHHLHSYYTNIVQTANFNEVKKVTPKTVLGTVGDLSFNKSKGLLFYIHQKDKFIHPFLIFPSLNQLNGTVKMDSLLIESGIFKQFLYRKAESVTLPLRGEFSFFMKAYEEMPSVRQNESLKEININIQCNETKEIVLNNTVRYNFIQNNKLSNIYSYNDLYNNYHSVEFIFLGKWIKKSRMNTYTITVTAIGYNGGRGSGSIQASFR